MKFELDRPVTEATDVAFLEAPGKYHCRVDWIEEEPTKADGSMIDNALFRVHAIVCDGTTAGQRDKELQLMFFSPKMSNKGGGEMARQKIRNFATAIGCCEEGKSADGAPQMVILFGPEVGAADYDEGDDKIGSLYACGRQFVCEVEKDREGRFMQLRYANVWHVDNPVVKDVPKCKEHLKLLPPALRKTAKDFAKHDKDKGKGGAAGTAAKSPPTTPTKPAAAAETVSVDEL